MFGDHLVSDLGFTRDAAEALNDFLASQARAQGGALLPSPGVVAAELFRDPTGKAEMTTVVLHTLRGAAVNEPLGIALGAAMGEQLGLRVDTLSDDNSILLAAPLANADEAEKALRSALSELSTPHGLAARIRESLAGSASFGAHFRENAGRALLLPKSGFRKRTPLWVTRLRSKRLFEKTSAYPDFPIIAETWKSVLEGRFDLPGTTALCSSLADGTIALAVFKPHAPTPFSRQSGWAVTNRYLYEGDDMQQGTGGPAPGDAAIQAAMDDPSVRPAIPESLQLEFGRKQRRELPLWAPESPDALASWVDERVLIPLDEWEELLAACPADLASSVRQTLATPGTGEGILSRLAVIRLPGASLDAVVRRERADALIASIALDPGTVIAEWLASTGVTSFMRLRDLFGIADLNTVASAIQQLGSIVRLDLGGEPDSITSPGTGTAACDKYAFESLLRQTRKAARPSIRTLPLDALPAFIASIQGLRDRTETGHPASSGRASGGITEEGIAATRRALDSLSGFPAPAALWETEILPARVPGYRPEYLDDLLSAGEFLWFGSGPRTVAFASVTDFEAFAG